MATKALSKTIANISNKITLKWTTEQERLVACFADPEQTYLYMVTVDMSGVPKVRKLTIARDINHARAQMKKGKSLIDKMVKFSVRQGWSGDVWFNDIESFIKPI